jgi:pimeloyl-ACP methyl ester carboxylesterase
VIYLLAQPRSLPERLIAADPDTFFGHFLDTWAAESAAISPDVRDDLRTIVLKCGHFLPEERPDEVAEAVTSLLSD